MIYMLWVVWLTKWNQVCGTVHSHQEDHCQCSCTWQSGSWSNQLGARSADTSFLPACTHTRHNALWKLLATNSYRLCLPFKRPLMSASLWPLTLSCQVRLILPFDLSETHLFYIQGCIDQLDHVDSTHWPTDMLNIVKRHVVLLSSSLGCVLSSGTSRLVVISPKPSTFTSSLQAWLARSNLIVFSWLRHKHLTFCQSKDSTLTR